MQTVTRLNPRVALRLATPEVSRPLATSVINVAEENSLRQNLIDQLTFSPMLDSIVQQPSIRYVDQGSRSILKPTVYARLWYADPEAGQPSGYVIEALPEAELGQRRVPDSERFAAAQKWAADRGAWFRILTERELRTHYLANARRLLP